MELDQSYFGLLAVEIRSVFLLPEGSAYQVKCQSCSTCSSSTIIGGKDTQPHSRFTRGTQLLSGDCHRATSLSLVLSGTSL